MFGLTLITTKKLQELQEEVQLARGFANWLENKLAGINVMKSNLKTYEDRAQECRANKELYSEKDPDYARFWERMECYYTKKVND